MTAGASRFPLQRLGLAAALYVLASSAVAKPPAEAGEGQRTELLPSSRSTGMAMASFHPARRSSRIGAMAAAPPAPARRFLSTRAII